MSTLRWWQRPFTFTLGDGTVKQVELRIIRHLTRDLRANPAAYQAIEERMSQAREWLKLKGRAIND